MTNKTHHSRLLQIGLLGLCLSWIGCTQSSDGPEASDYIQHEANSNGRVVKIVDAQDAEAYMKAVGGAAPEAAIATPAAETEIEKACRVTLLYCNDPQGGGSTCSARGCTLARAFDACVSLISDTCGFSS